MKFFSLAKKKEELILLFDIGSSSVSGAIFRKDKSKSPTILFSVREFIPIQDEVDFEKLSASMLKTLGIVANKICMKGLGAPSKIYCTLSSPWYASQTRTIKYSKNTEFIFNAKLSDSLIEKEVKIFEEEHGLSYDPNPHAVKLIEVKNMKTILNGYTATSPIGQKAKDLEMIVFLSMSSNQVLENIKEAVARHFHNEVSFISFVVSSFAVARDMFINQENFLLVDIAGEMTDISMIKKDVLRESISYPMGHNFIIRGLALALGCTLNEAKSYLSLYKDGHSTNEMGDKLSPIIEKLKIEWLKKFQESLMGISNDISIPSTVFITVDPELANFFAETIKTEQFSQYSLTQAKFRVVFLGTEMLHGIASFEGNTFRDPFIIIESIYINRFLS